VRNLNNLWFEDKDLERLLWKKWKNGGGYWLYCDEAEALTNKIRINGGCIRIGDFVYGIRQRDQKFFIVRLPAKKNGLIEKEGQR
jgi:hypothetical protein